MNEKKIYTEEQAKEFASKIAQLVTKDIQVSDTDGTFKVIASDETMDRHGEIIKVTGWKTDNFMKNPVILFGHDYRSVENIVGRATRVYVEDSKLIIEGVFAPADANPKAQQVRKLYEGGFINTVSVGLMPISRDPKNWEVILEAELLECSFVPVPANPSALGVKGLDEETLLKSGLIYKEVAQHDQDQELTLKDVFTIVSDIKGIVVGIDMGFKSFTESFADGKANNEAEAMKPLLQAAVKAISTTLAKMKQ